MDVLYVEVLGGMCRTLTSECHEYTLGLTLLDGIDDGAARCEETIAGCADYHVGSAVIRNHYRKFTMGSKEP